MSAHRSWARRINAAVALAAAALSCSAPVPPQSSESRVRARLFDASGRARLGGTCERRGIETCFDARDDDCNGLVDEGCGLPDGALQLIVAWEVPEVDVELEVFDPKGQQARPGQMTGCGLTKDRDCPRSLGGCGGQNVEVVHSEAVRLVEGRYLIVLRLVSPEQVPGTTEVHLGGHVGREPISGAFRLEAPNPEIRVELELGRWYGQVAQRR